MVLTVKNDILCPQCGVVMEQYDGRISEDGKPEKLWYCLEHGTFCDWSLKKKNQIDRTITCYWCGNNRGYLIKSNPYVPDHECLKCGGRFP